jgi:hypothetical protein
MKRTILSAALITAALIGASTLPAQHAPAQRDTASNTLEVANYHIPENLATIKERHEGASGKTILYIQDAHCNFEAQSNNAKILEELVKNHGVKLVAVEGSTGLIDTAPFSQFPDKDIKTEVATYFMKKGRITGPEYLSITSDLKFMIWGIEDENAYKENYDAFVKTITAKDQNRKVLDQLGRGLEITKQNIFSAALKELDAKMNGYRNNTIPFLDYAKYLTAKARGAGIDLAGYPNFNQQNRALVLETAIDFKRVDQERGSCIDALSKKMGKDKLSELVTKSLSFRLGKIPAEDYYAFLKDTAQAAGIDFGKFKNLSQYTDYVALLKNIKAAELINECDRLADDIKEKLFKNDDERAVNRAAKDLVTLENLFELKLSPADFEYFEKNRARSSSTSLLDILNKYQSRFNLALPDRRDLEGIDNYIPTAEHFYRVAKKRDNILIQNTADKMQQENADRAVLVAGGFHTDGIADILRDKGFSYIVITPRITNPNAENPYLDVMLNKKTPFEELLMSSEPAK